MNDASKPLPNSRHEAFARAIAHGHRLGPAYERAGFVGKSRRLSWELRHRPEVEARIAWLLDERVRADTRAYSRREKRRGNLLDRALKELEAIAFQDIREVADWRREPILNAEGEVVDFRESLALRASAALPGAAAKAVKGVFLKSGQVRIELHDKRLALESLIKLLSGKGAPPPTSVTVQQVSIGDINAIEAATRVAFLLASVTAGRSDLKSQQYRRANRPHPIFQATTPFSCPTPQGKGASDSP